MDPLSLESQIYDSLHSLATGFEAQEIIRDGESMRI
jgi:hypothetical protein